MEYKKLGDIATYINGYPFKPEDRGECGLPIIRIQDLTGNTYDLGYYDGKYPERIEINNGDILISWSASLGVYVWNRGKALLNQHIFKVVFDKVEINKRYFVYAVQFKLKEMEAKTHGATMKHIVKKDFDSTLIPYPSLKEQSRIAEIIDSIAKSINMRQKQLQKLDELVKARFVEMFVATDAASDWPYCTIADVSNDMRTGPFGSALHHDEFVDSGVFVLGIDNAVENKFSYNRMRYITAEKYQELKRYTVYPGDVIITIMGTVGRSAVIPADMPKAINTKHLACITPNAKMVNAQFLSCAFQVHPDIRAQLQKQCKGAIMDGLNLTIIKGLSFHIPPINLQDRFVGFYEQVDKSKAAIQKALDEAQLLFDSLMQKYFG